jgi:hypothetical protein
MIDQRQRRLIDPVQITKNDQGRLVSPPARMSAGGGTISLVRTIGCFDISRKALPYLFVYST